MSRQLIIPLVLVLATVALLVCQCTVAHIWRPWGLRLEFLPALLLYAAFTLGMPTAILLSVAAALMYDTFSAGPFGGSLIPFIAVTAMFCALRPVFFRNRISTQFVSGFVFALLALPVQWLLGGKFMVSWNVVFPKLMHLSIFCGVLAILYFTIFDFFFRLVGLNPGRFEDDLE